ncbi:MAG TPA: DUF3422 domain-containing protein [Bradyrhizobium sp.]|nr:DUF3422 domain-containing protein [Bradyrhizobium sp.]
MQSSSVGPAAATPLAIAGASGPWLGNHPLRDQLANEVHARPVTPMLAPDRASHLAFLTGEAGALEDHAQLVRLCQRYGVAAPQPGINYFTHDFGSFRARWERHTEFVTYTFFQSGPSPDFFARPAVESVARDWLQMLPNSLLVAVHVALLPRTTPPPGASELARYFVADSLVGSRVAGGAATVYADYRIHADGYGRLLIHDHGLTERQAGRLVQRLLEIETYRMAALLALPLARQAAPEIARIENGLASAMTTMASASDSDDHSLLDGLTRLAADIEKLSSASSYRFGAARAYYALIERRIDELREERIEGLQTIAEFMDRRLRPAMHTCQSVAERQESLSQRVSRANNLLRTRVDVALEGQNRDLLASMDRRAQMQLRLQQTVEGLSVVAISYYLLGLLSYALKSAKGLHLPVDPDTAPGLALPVVLGLVWWGVHRLRKRLTRETRERR